MDYTLFLASYVATLADRPRRDRIRDEEQYFLDNADTQARYPLRRAVIAVALISLSYLGLAVVAGADMGLREATTLVS
ncbi:hypothetical protein VE25_08070 [Devosia geojensis]|uniref:Uncharacterized protein n=1 Tax=Devosia geojensis TaxID=443610 RepID=A0A0F5FVL0_9HYPH|nr:hypothetical protein [Devosia geojensis]KKB12212.1 hypothetical protein VE25_08070 [Devosia geojensis]